MEGGNEMDFVFRAYASRCERRDIKIVQVGKWDFGRKMCEGWRREAVGQ